MDLISVIMPFYKKKPYFSNTLKSVLNQSYRNIEIIIVYDDNDLDDLNHIKSLVTNLETKVFKNQKVNLFHFLIVMTFGCQKKSNFNTNLCVKIIIELLILITK